MNVEASPAHATTVHSINRRTTTYLTKDTPLFKSFREFLVLDRPTLVVLAVLHQGEVAVHTMRRRGLMRADVLGAFSLSLFMGPKHVADLEDDHRINLQVARRWIDELSERYPPFDDERHIAFFGLTDHGFFRKGDVGILMEAMHAFACGKDSS